MCSLVVDNDWMFEGVWKLSLADCVTDKLDKWKGIEMPGGHPTFILHMPNIPASAILRQTKKKTKREEKERGGGGGGEKEWEKERERDRGGERARERESKKEREREREPELIIPKNLVTNSFIHKRKCIHTVTSTSKVWQSLYFAEKRVSNLATITCTHKVVSDDNISGSETSPRLLFLNLYPQVSKDSLSIDIVKIAKMLQNRKCTFRKYNHFEGAFARQQLMKTS